MVGLISRPPVRSRPPSRRERRARRRGRARSPTRSKTGAPFEEFVEQLLAFGFRQRPARAHAGREKLLELVALGVDILLARLPKRLFGALEAFPPGQRCGQHGILPLFVTRGLPEFLQAREEGLDELVDAPVAVG